MSSSCSRCAACRRLSAPCKRFATSASTAVPARSTPSSGRTGPGNRRCSGSPAAFSLPTRARVEIGGHRAPASLPCRERAASVSAWPIRRTRTSSHLSVAENLYLAAPAEPPTDVRTHDELGGGAARRVRSRHPAERCRRDALARAAAAARGREGPARPAEGAAARRADDRPRAGGRRATPRARSRAVPRGCRSRLRQPPAPGGARPRGPDHRPSRRRQPGHVRRRLHVGGDPRRADDRASARARLSGAARARRPSARCCSPSRDCRATGSGRSISKSRAARSWGSPVPRATGRCSSSGRSPASERADRARRPATARSSTRARRSGRCARESCC